MSDGVPLEQWWWSMMAPYSSASSSSLCLSVSQSSQSVQSISLLSPALTGCRPSQRLQLPVRALSLAPAKPRVAGAVSAWPPLSRIESYA